MDMRGSAEARAAEIKTRRLEIAADLAERRRAFFADGVSTPMAERAALQAEDARLALELRQIGAAAVQAKVERRVQLQSSLLSQLLALLDERGLGDVIAEAKRRASAAEPTTTTASEGDPA